MKRDTIIIWMILAFIITGFSSIASAENPYDVAWIRQIGTSAEDGSNCVAVDSNGNVFISGYTMGSLVGSNAGRSDIFVGKYNSSGNLLWTRQLGTSMGEKSYGVASDAAGNVFITGWTEGSLGGTFAGGNNDAFVCKYDVSGNLLWTRQLGTSSDDMSYGITVDASGNIFISGVTSGDLGGTHAGFGDAFVSKYDTTGSLLWTRQLGTSHDEHSYGVAVDSTGNIFISGTTDGILGQTRGGYDAFVGKYDPTGNLLWTRQEGSATKDESHGVTTDPAGNVFIGGYSFQDYVAFIDKYDADGNLLWKRLLGTNGKQTYGYGVAADRYGNVFVTGWTEGNLGGPNAGSRDVFVSKYNPNGDLLWTSQLGTYSQEMSFGIVVDNVGNVFISGQTWGSFGGSNAGSADSFVVKYNAPLPPVLLNLEVIGPNAVAENSQSQYQAIVHYDDDSTKDVTAITNWSVEPNTFASIGGGLLQLGHIQFTQDINILARYTENNATVETGKIILIYSLSSADTDKDALPDAWEIAKGLVVGQQDAFIDSDDDGLTNYEEWIRNNNPKEQAAASNGFIVYNTLTTQGIPLDVAAADLNRDGNTDVVTLTATTLEIRYGQEDGTFGPATILTPQLKQGSSGPHCIAIGDFNWDGKLDIVITSDDASSRIEVFLGNGAGGFTTSYYQDILWFRTKKVAVADFNKDGKQDIIAVNDGQRDWRVVGGTGDGTFYDSAFGQNAYSRSQVAMITADFDHDGDIDFATAGNGHVTVRLNDGTGQFGITWGGNRYDGLDPLAAATAIDYNGDGYVDIALYGGSTVMLKAGNAAGGFDNGGTIDVGGTAVDIKAMDYNGDGYTDLVMTSSANELILLPANGAGGFGTAQHISLNFTPSVMAVGNFYNDGREDLLIASQNTNEVKVLIGKTAAPRVIEAALTVDASADFSNGGSVLKTLETMVFMQNLAFANIDRRGIIEFNISGIPDEAIITSATLTLDIEAMSYSQGIYPILHVHGYAGNGIAEIADGHAALNQIGQSNPITGLGTTSINLNINYIETLRSSTNYLGLLLLCDENGKQAGFNTMEGIVPGVKFAPNLTIQYQTCDLAGDINGDCQVNFIDFGLAAKKWKVNGCGEPDWCGGDLNHDGSVNIKDVAIIASHWLE